MRHKKGLRFLVFGLISFVLMVFIGQQVSAQNNVPNINGQWTYRALGFEVSGNGCGTEDRGGQIESTVTINQRGNQFTSNGGTVYRVPSTDPVPRFVSTAIGEGTITNNQIQSRIQDTDYRSTTSSNTTNRTFSWSGTISPDGNTISGNATCLSRGVFRGTPYSNQDSLSFTLTRGSQSTLNQTNTPPTPQPNPIQTPSNSQAPPFPLDAGPNTIRPDFRGQ